MCLWVWGASLPLSLPAPSSYLPPSRSHKDAYIPSLDEVCYSSIVVFLSGELVPPLFLESHHLTGVRSAGQLDSPTESPACSVCLHGLLETANLLVEITCLFVQASIHKRAGYLLQQVVLGAQLLT